MTMTHINVSFQVFENEECSNGDPEVLERLGSEKTVSKNESRLHETASFDSFKSVVAQIQTLTWPCRGFASSNKRLSHSPNVQD